MRRQRRAAELQDKRDRQKLGLLPPDPPKGKSSHLPNPPITLPIHTSHTNLTNRPPTVKVANMMKVLTASAVQDPTKVEARVKAEAQARLRKHEQTNAERALTDEQRREKVEAKKVKEEGKGVYGCAFK